MVEKKLPNIVAIGGGTGLSTFLRGLKRFPVDITAIVTMADDGGSSGVLREGLNIPPPGDVRNVLVALSNSPEKMQELLQFRFQTEKNQYLDGHPVGNLILAAMTQICGGDFAQAVEQMAEMFNVNGKIFPVSYKGAALCGLCIGGNVIKGESNFAKNEEQLVSVFYESDVKVIPGVIDALLEADVIVLGPGSLYTSVLPNVIVPKVAEAINKNSRADIVYISNIMTENGETNNYSVHDHVESLYRHGLKRVDYVIVNDEKIPQKILKKYALEAASVVEHHVNDLASYEVIFSRIVRIEDDIVRHDPIKTAAAVYSIALKHM